MPIYKSRTVVEIARNLRAFLELNAGLVRGAVPDPDVTTRQLEDAQERISQLRAQLAEKDRRLKQVEKGTPRAGVSAAGIRPENMLWIFGYGRTGSTWLSAMMNTLSNQTMWHEPFVGQLFGLFYYNWVGEKHFDTRHFILGRPRESWLNSVRSFVLEQASVKFPEVARSGQYLVVKEPNGSVGAPILMEALPECPLIVLIRDPRDVTASRLDAFKEGSWLYKAVVEEGSGRTTMFDMEQQALVENTANEYLQSIGNSWEAYEKHPGPKFLLKYEELSADTLGTMKRMYSALGVTVDDGELERAVEKHTWENIPAEDKGEGKFYRKAALGGWREDLAPEHVETVERITAPLLERFYPEKPKERSGPL